MEKHSKKRRIITLSIVTLIVLTSIGLTAASPGRAFFAFLFAPADGVRVHEIRVDRKARSFVEIVFNHPVAPMQVGEILTDPPASIFPAIRGVWRWYTGNVLRFEPAAPLPMASEYKLVLASARLGSGDKSFAGPREFVVKTDEFLVRRVTWSEIPSAGAKVVLQGDVQFNYDVRPEALASRIRIRDGERQLKVELLSSWPQQTLSWRSVPIQKEKSPRDVDLIIDRDLFPSQGNVTLTAEVRQKIHLGSRDVLAVRGVKATPGEHESTIRIELSSPVRAEAVTERTTITPAVRFRVESEGNDALLIGHFAPGTSYDLSIGDGLLATDNALLSAGYRQKIEVPDLEPMLAFQSEGMFLAASGARNIAVESINTSHATLNIDRVYRNNLFFYLQDNGSSSYGEEGDQDEETSSYYRAYYNSGPVEHRYGDRIVEKELELPAQKNVRQKSVIPLGALVRKFSPGLYKVSLIRDNEYSGACRWILITDLGIVAKRAAGETMVWVSSFHDLSPAANARVTILDDQNQVMAHGTTDGRGLWTTEKMRSGRPFLLTVERGNDFSILLLGNSRVDLASFEVEGESVGQEGYSAFLYGERSLYRPGETMRGVAVVRTRGLQAPPKMPLVLRHLDPAGEKRGSQRLEADSSGLASFELPLPPYSRTGNHTLELLAGAEVIGRTTVHVEEFVPDRIKVEIQIPTAASSPLKFAVSSAYLFGAPAASLNVETRVKLAPASFTAKGFEQFTFGCPSRKFDPRDLSSDNSTLDAKGEKSYEIPLPEHLAVPASLEAIVTTRVQEQGGRGVSALARIPVYPYPAFIGLRPAGGGGNSERRFEWVNVSAAGVEKPAPPLRAELYEDKWHTVLRETSNGNYSYESTKESELLKTISIAGGKSRGSVTLPAKEWGSFRLIVSDPVTLAASEVEYEAWQSGYSPWAMKNPGRLELTLDKSSYRSGESAVVTIKSPFRGRALVTVERDRVFHSTIVELASNTARVTLPLTLAERPNAYITATVIRSADDLEPGEAGRAFGAIRVDVDRLENELHPLITAVEDLRSMHQLKVAVHTTPKSKVTIAAVDLGILQLVSEKRPDPFAYFYRRLRLDVDTHDIFALLLPEVPARGRSAAGGSESGEGVSQFLRTDGMRRSRPVSFWSGVLTADASGKASTTFDVPDFQGALRVTAVVHAGDHFGSSERVVRVHDPIVVQLTVPRFVSEGDNFSVPVTIRNDTSSTGTFQVTARVTGRGALAGPASQQISIDRQREQTVLFTLQAESRVGPMSLAFEARGNGQRGTATSTFSVLPSLPDATEEVSGNPSGPNLTLPAVPTGRFEGGTITRELFVSPFPIVQFRGRLDYLVHYPYGCVEQTTSTAFPMLYLGDIASELDPSSFRSRNAPGYVREAIRRLGTMQTSGGGFAMWPYGEEVNVWGSIYAMHFLVEAKRAGFSTDGVELSRGLDYLTQLAKARDSYDHDGLQESVYALYVLSRAQRPELGTMDYIREKESGQLTFEGRGLLAAAYASVGNGPAADVLLADIQREEEVVRQTGGNYNSLLRNRALLILALLDAAPSDSRLSQLVARLVRDLSAEPAYTTQESALALVALGQIYQHQKALGTYSGALMLDGRKIANVTSHTSRFPDLPASGTLQLVFDAPYPGNAAFYSLRTRGTPNRATFHSQANGIRMTREFLDRNGAPLPGMSVHQGEIVVIRTSVESVAGEIQNVVVQNLLPAGLEVENPRLTTTESLPWVQSIAAPQHADLRDDRVLFFVDLHAGTKLTFYTVARAVTPGSFTLPPAQAEAMYAPSFRATEAPAVFRVTR